MNIIRKDATVAPIADDGTGPGEFHVILSAQTLDRDGDVLKSEDWDLPLPDHITFDQDHGMSVASLVGSGAPFINKDTGNLEVKGTFAGTPEGQKVRQLVKEGHCRTTSVAFMSKKVAKANGEGTRTVRELLNGAFVAIPSNREAVVLSSKSGARNNKTDAEAIQNIHDQSASLGADCAAAPAKAVSVWGLGRKTVAGSYEQNQSAISDALSALYTGDDVWAYPSATFDDSVVFHVYGGPDSGQWQASYTTNGDGTVSLGTPVRVNLVEQIIPAKHFGRKDADTTDDDSPMALIPAIDAAIDQAIDLLASVDATTLPAEVQQAIALVQAADSTVDQLMDVLGIPDPDDEDEGEPANGTAQTLNAGAAKAAPVDGAKAAPTTEESDALEVMKMRLQLHQRLANI